MNNFAKVYYDAEFTGLHRNTTLISIGLVSEDGHIFYAEFTDYDRRQVDDWIQQHVIRNLPYNAIEQIVHTTATAVDISNGNNLPFNAKIKGEMDTVKRVLIQWLDAISESTGKKIQFYTDCYAYDWVLLNDLICEGCNALNLPSNLYYIPIDLSTCLQVHGVDPDITREDFAGDSIRYLQTIDPFNRWGDNIKHNSLWDAYICKLCFDKLASSQK